MGWCRFLMFPNLRCELNIWAQGETNIVSYMLPVSKLPAHSTHPFPEARPRFNVNTGTDRIQTSSM